MGEQETVRQGSASGRARRDRVGISIGAIGGGAARTLADAVVAAEQAGVAQIWMTQNPVSVDTLTVFAAALSRTERIRVGTSIVPTYPRHPLALAQQAETVDAFGPGRLRLGVGPSHRPTIEGVYGITMDAPLAHLRAYVDVLRGALWHGAVDHRSAFFTAKATLRGAPRVPLLVSALGAGAFHLAGEISDGAISWNCPPRYLADVALPALRAGAAVAGRPTPPLVAHLWVAPGAAPGAARDAARQGLAVYARLPFYAQMFAAAGHPVQPDGSVSDGLLDTIVAAGDEGQVAARLDELLAAGFDELLLTHVPMGDADSERARLIAFAGSL